MDLCIDWAYVRLYFAYDLPIHLAADHVVDHDMVNSGVVREFIATRQLACLVSPTGVHRLSQVRVEVAIAVVANIARPRKDLWMFCVHRLCSTAKSANVRMQVILSLSWDVNNHLAM